MLPRPSPRSEHPAQHRLVLDIALLALTSLAMMLLRRDAHMSLPPPPADELNP
jgi:hypothetical protein